MNLLRTVPLVLSLGLSPNIAMSNENADCTKDGLMAEMIMVYRQLDGVGIDEAMEKFGSEPGLRRMVTHAFQKPMMPTETSRQSIISDFRNHWSDECQNGSSVFSQTAD